MRSSITCIALVHKFTIRAVAIIGMLEPEAVTISVFSEPLFIPYAWFSVFGGSCGAGETCRGFFKKYIMVMGGCSVTVDHSIRGE